MDTPQEGQTRGAGNVDKSSGTRAKKKNEEKIPRRGRYPRTRGYRAGFMTRDFFAGGGTKRRGKGWKRALSSRGWPACYAEEKVTGRSAG